MYNLDADTLQLLYSTMSPGIVEVIVFGSPKHVPGGDELKSEIAETIVLQLGECL